MRALGYFLVREDAPVGHALSRASQESRFHQYCATYAHNPIGIFAEDHRDEARPQYRRMVEVIQQSGLGYLVLLSDSRHLGADLESAVRRLLELDALQTQVRCMDDEHPDPLQGLVRLGSTGESASARRQQVIEGMHAKAARGEGLGRPPYGYRIGGEGRLEPVPREVEVVGKIFQWYLDQGLGVRTIARRLNEEGHATRRGQSWSMVTIRDILRNHAYIGTYTRFGLRIPGSHPGLVTPQEFKQVQDRMRERSPGRRAAPGEPYLLSGMATCGHCGGPMMGVTRLRVWRRKDGQRVRGHYRYYQCQSRTNRSQCQYHTWHAADLERLVVRQARERVATETGFPEPADPSVMQNERRRLESRLRSLERRFQEQVRRAATGVITLQHLRQLMAEMQGEKEVTREGLARLSADPAKLRASREEDVRRLAGWEQLGGEERQGLLHRLLARVTVCDDHVEVALR